MVDTLQKFKSFIELEKLQPPRPGLVPQTGDYEHPYRWIRPEKRQSQEDLRWERPKERLASPKVFLGKPYVFDPGFPLEKVKDVFIEVAKLLPDSHFSGIKKFRFNIYGFEIIEKPKKWMEAIGGIPKYPASTTMSGTIELPVEFDKSTLIHEISHTLFMKLGKDRYGPFQSELETEVVLAYKNAKETNSGFPSNYSKRNLNEFWAECYTAYVLEREKFKERNPEMFSILQKLFTVHA